MPVDGATNIKLEVLDFETLEPLYSRSAPTPVSVQGGLDYNCAGAQLEWYSSVIEGLPRELKNCRVIAPAARGASGALVGHDGSLCERPGEDLALAYTQAYPESVESAFREVAGGADEFFLRTGSVRDYPGSLTLLKRFVYEQMERPGALARSSCFASWGALLAGYFLGDFREAVSLAGNEHGYWMCHSGAREIGASPGTPSAASGKVESFRRLVPERPSVAYKPVGTISRSLRSRLGLPESAVVVPGGHDTCLSHLPVIAAFKGRRGAGSLIHLEAGSWTMVALIGPWRGLPAEGHRRSLVVQGTLDGDPVATSMYGGGRDYRFLESLFAPGAFRADRQDWRELLGALSADGCYVLPNINPENHGTGPFPNLKGKILGRGKFLEHPGRAGVHASLCVAACVSEQLNLLRAGREVPVVLTGGGSLDPYLACLVAGLSGCRVYCLRTRDGDILSETTSLGAAVTGKAACLGCHPERIDLSGMGPACSEQDPPPDEVLSGLLRWKEVFIREIEAESARNANTQTSEP